MKRILSIFISCVFSICTFADVTVFSFSSSQYEKSAADTIVNQIHGKVVDISVTDGKINEAVAAFDSIKKDGDYAIIGTGSLGSAAATICASESSPEFLVLISGVGVDGTDFVKRFSMASTFFIEPKMSAKVRRTVQTEIARGECGETFPPEFKELLAYRPNQFLRRINCPTLCVFGTADAIGDWYANGLGMEEGLPVSEKNIIRVYPRTGYCLRESETDDNIPFIGDKKQDTSKLNTQAIADIVLWVSNQKIQSFDMHSFQHFVETHHGASSPFMAVIHIQRTLHGASLR